MYNNHILFVIICFLVGLALSFLCVFSKINKCGQLGLVTIVYLPIAFLFGMREGVGRDYYVYVQDYFNINELSQFYVEPGFIFLNKLGWLSGFGYSSVFIFSSVISFVLIGKRISKDSDNPILSLCVLFGIGYFTFAASAVRQAIAVAVFFYSLPYVWNRCFLRFTATVLMGSLFHFSVIYMIPFYFLVKIKFYTVLLFLIFFLSIIMGLFGAGIISVLLSLITDSAFFQHYAGYVDRSLDSDVGLNSGFGVLLYILIALYVFTCDPAIKSNVCSKDKVLALFVFFGFCGFVASSSTMDLSRIFQYLSIATVLWVPSRLNRINNVRYKKVAVFLIPLFWIIFGMLPLFLNPTVFDPSIQ